MSILQATRRIRTAALVVLSACGDSTATSDLDLGTFELAATGAFTQSMTGGASFNVGPPFQFPEEDDGSPRFSLTLFGPDQQFFAILAGHSRPGTGRITYQLGSDQLVMKFHTRTNAGLAIPRTFLGLSGHVDISTSSLNEVSGTFDVVVEDGETLHITGRFRAECFTPCQ